MFSNACRVAQNFTKPVIVATRTINGVVSCGLATFVIVNKDGWIVTAAHVIRAITLQQQHEAERLAYETKLQELQHDPHLSHGARKARLKALVKNPNWITNFWLCWGTNQARVEQFMVDNEADVAVGRLKEYDLGAMTVFPKFKKPATDPPPGTSVCRLGFPFFNVQATFDDVTKGFNLQSFQMPPMFPNDGICTRIKLHVIVQTPPVAGQPLPVPQRSIKFIETSTPGLRGQSGGPLFDINGAVWGIQSHTSHLDLNFSARAKEGNREVIEHQFMNIGFASHVQNVLRLLGKASASYKVEP